VRRAAVIDPDQLVLLIAEAQDAESIDGGTVDLLNSLGFEW
jgi:hypothetical protein